MNQRLILCLLAILAALFVAPMRAEDEFTPVDITLQDRAVVMELAEGIRRVRLRVRQGDGTWKLQTIAHLQGSERYLKLRLPDGSAAEDIEVAASFTDPFPYSFYLGKTSFAPTAGNGSGDFFPYAFSRGGLDDTMMLDQVVPLATTPDAETTPEATVEESDIWKWRGDTLYFFNQYRGLQVIDVADPAAPERLVTHPIPSGGEQMYLHPSADLVALLAHDPMNGHGEVVLVRHPSARVLKEQQRIPLPGSILESRMVGSILYVVCRHSREVRTIDPETGDNHVVWRSGITVTKIDLSAPDQPAVTPALELNSDRYNYWGSQVQATPKALLISTTAYDSTLRQSVSTVHVVDISDPEAKPAVTHHLPVAGQVLNKFNMSLDRDILTVVSQVWRGDTTRRRYASVETFDLGAATASRPLGSVEFAPNESITATRFVGDLCYVVTFLRIDPLFVVSLADPANPRLLGELEIPGFSTYLEPYGKDALISVGVEGSRIAVSWFDVSNPEKPALASRVYVGPENGSSWTEANWDEKAFGFFPEEQLILLPYQGSDPERGWITGVQAIELGDQELIKRGSFENEFQARRARVLDSAIASISGRSLRTLDISDPDQPEILADLPLAWPADLVHRIGDHLIQLERGSTSWSPWSAAQGSAKLLVSPASDPESIITSLDLGTGRVVGSFLHKDVLWLAQVSQGTSAKDDPYLATEFFTVTSIDVSIPAEPRIAGRATRSTASKGYDTGFYQDLIGALLPEGTLCWYPANATSPAYRGGPIGWPGGIPIQIDSLMPYYYSQGPGRVHTIRITDVEHPAVLACIELSNPDGHGSEGAIRLAGSRLYRGSRSTVLVDQPGGTRTFQTAHWLQQLDLSDPATPVHHDPAKLPGTFENIFQTPFGGLVLHTSFTHSSYVKEVWTTEFRVQALAFDGLTAHLLDELVIPDRGSGPSLFDGPWVIVGRNIHEIDNARTELAIHQWHPSGSFGTLHTLERPGTIHQLHLSDQLLIASESGGLSFIDFVEPANPAPATVSTTNTRYWQELRLIDIHHREFAYVPRGMWGVETVDLRDVFRPPLAPYSRDGDRPGNPEWMIVDLDTLRQTDAGDPMVIGALDDDLAWIVEEVVTPVRYEEWVRNALGLGADAPLPAPDEDSDRDGLSNRWEFHTGTDPGQSASGAPPRTFLGTGPDGGRFLGVRIFLNPHATGTLQMKSSTDGLHWSPDQDAEFHADPFSPSVRVRIPVGKGDPPAQLLQFSFR